jgi:hypothetical protein
MKTCTNLLRKKYLKEKGFFYVKASGGSQFWRGLHEIKHTCEKGLKYVLGNGKKICHDTIGESRLDYRTAELDN